MLGLGPRSLEKSPSGAARPSDPVPVPTTQSHETVSVSSQGFAETGAVSQLHILRYDPKRRCATGIAAHRRLSSPRLWGPQGGPRRRTGRLNGLVSARG